eukprot:CAMPEP_0195583858 /NCGR_PEP_ID=MMETSP0814-20130614/24872_1 /TAXON_ID=97485 /ORGANISM="Prymnesium parvum, Strain Texoma1" /LENGTH=41 /DNA_ID= /DNA_START= /DNA_END= /DNA_ORIENTATION=
MSDKPLVSSPSLPLLTTATTSTGVGSVGVLPASFSAADLSA